MSEKHPLKWRCTDCGHISEGSAGHVALFLRHPKTGEMTCHATQCAECGAVEGFDNLCDEPGCEHNATWGWPTSYDDYRRTCHKHGIAAEARGEHETPEARKLRVEKMLNQ